MSLNEIQFSPDQPDAAMAVGDLSGLFSCDRANRGFARMDFDEAACLYRWTYAAPVGARCIEIGRFNGGSTIIMAAALLAKERATRREVGSVRDGEDVPTSALVSIDKAPRNDELLRLMLRANGADGKVALAVHDSTTFPWHNKTAGVNVVLVDGDHSYEGAKRDHFTWGRRLYAGGVIIHHDMAKTRPNATQIPELARLRADILKHQATCLELVDEVGSISVFRRRGSCFSHF